MPSFPADTPYLPSRSHFHCSHCGSIHVAGDCALEPPVAGGILDGSGADDHRAGDVPAHELQIRDLTGRMRVRFTSKSVLPILSIPSFLLEAMPAMESAFLVGDRSGPYLLVVVPKERTSPVEVAFANQFVDPIDEGLGEARDDRDAREVG